MATCSNCGADIPQGASFCASCGTSVNQKVQPVVDPFDHTGEFDPKDVSDNKVIAMAAYMLGFFGIIIALLASKDSPYTMFHARQSLKICVSMILLGLLNALLCWTVIVPIAGIICMVALLVVNIICFFRVCAGKSKEAPIVCKLDFLR